MNEHDDKDARWQRREELLRLMSECLGVRWTDFGVELMFAAPSEKYGTRLLVPGRGKTRMDKLLSALEGYQQIASKP